MIDGIQFVRSLGQHRLGDDQLTDQVNELIDLLNRYADAGRLAGAGWFFTLRAPMWRFTGGGFHRWRNGNRLRLRDNGYLFSFNSRGRCADGFEFNLVSFNDKAEYCNDVIFCEVAIKRS